MVDPITLHMIFPTSILGVPSTPRAHRTWGPWPARTKKGNAKPMGKPWKKKPWEEQGKLWKVSSWSFKLWDGQPNRLQSASWKGIAIDGPRMSQTNQENPHLSSDSSGALRSVWCVCVLAFSEMVWCWWSKAPSKVVKSGCLMLVSKVPCSQWIGIYSVGQSPCRPIFHGSWSGS